MPTKPVYGLVLAGGESRRMGRDKALLVRDGKSQLSHVVALLESVSDRVFVSTRREQKEESERSQFEQIVDGYEGIGPVAGILSAMDAYPDVHWLIVACDLANIDEPTLSYLLENHSIKQPFTAFKSSYDELPEPLCAFYRYGSEAIIRQFVDDGIVCPRKIMIRSDSKLLDQPNPDALDNINTPDDLEHSILEAAS